MKQRAITLCIHLAFCIIGTILMVVPVRADSVITVNTTVDLIAEDENCSLREAIIAANTNNGFGGCNSGSGTDIIVFDHVLPPSEPFVLSLAGANEDDAQTGDLDIKGTLTISGTSSDVSATVIDGNGSDRIFHLLNGGRLSLLGLTVQYGNPGDAASGGGILTEQGSRLTITNSLIISNSALSGGGVFGAGRVTINDTRIEENSGGGLANDGSLDVLNRVQISHNSGDYGVRNISSGSLTMNGGSINENQKGGLYNSDSTATLAGVTILGNLEGGVVNTGASLSHLTISQSQIMSNSASSGGGGVTNEGSSAIASIYDSWISHNQSASNGGGLFNNGVMSVSGSTLDHNHARAGGGIQHFGGNLSLTNVTISQNSASDNGGGLQNVSSSVLKFVTFYQNTANGEGGNLFNDEAQISLKDTLVADALSGGNCVSSGGFVHSLGNNLESANSCQFTATGDITNSDPLLDPLQANGASTPTHALQATSPAIDHGSLNCDVVDLVKVDQRGIARPQGSACDIGAFEFAMMDTTPPSQVSNLTATQITASGTTLNWDAATDNVSVVGYRIYARQQGDPQVPFLVAQISGTVTSDVIDTLMADTSYQVWVVAFDEAGNVAALDNTQSVQFVTLALTVSTIQLTVEPAQPTTQDAISITVSGVYTDSCVPQYQSHQISDHLIAIQSMPSSEVICQTVETPWRYSVDLPPLQAGVYTVSHTLFAITTTLLFTVSEVAPPQPETIPVFEIDPSQSMTATIGVSFTLQIVATGSPTPTYTLDESPTGMTIDAQSGLLQWTPSDNISHTVTVRVTATNRAGSASYTFEIAVLPDAVELNQRTFLPVVSRP